MKTQACEPCARRKVRCDRQEPCSNCKRRKQDRCLYPEISSTDRIKRLEALVRSLGGEPEEQLERSQHSLSGVSDSVVPDKSRFTQAPDNVFDFNTSDRSVRDPVVVEENGQPVYLESRSWHGWLANSACDAAARKIGTQNPFSTPSHPHAFQNVLGSSSPSNPKPRLPNQLFASVLWRAYYDRIKPVIRISFTWQEKRLERLAILDDHQEQLTHGEIAYISSIYLLSALSLTKDECIRELQQSKTDILSALQSLCEAALTANNLFCMTDITMLKAALIYLIAGVDRLSTHSQYCLMGLLVRSAEKLGIHQDGAILGLSPAKTEERRRLWWQLQQTDLALGIRSGTTPMTIAGDWDVDLPLNIEDEDINDSMTEPPKPRDGLTSMSYALFTFWVFQHQRRNFRPNKGPFVLSWQSDRSLPSSTKGSLLEDLEQLINTKFLQYCDPIKPTHVLLQLVGRSLSCVMRLRTLLSLTHSKLLDDHSAEQRLALFQTCMQVLEYEIAAHTTPPIKRFEWLTSSFFPWHAFMCILVEASQEHDVVKLQQIWDTFTRLYAANADLWQLSEDRRKHHAAGLVVNAWKVYQTKFPPNNRMAKPHFVSQLENDLQHVSEQTTSEGIDKTANSQYGFVTNSLPITPESFAAEQDAIDAFELDLQDIDWTFWERMD